MVPDQLTEPALTVQLPKFATHVFGRPTIWGGKVVVTVPVCGLAVVFGTPNEPLTLLPGPEQASGSNNEAVGAGVKGFTTVTVNVQAAPDCGLHVTVVVPTAKPDPDGGVQVTTPQPPVTVGAA